MTNDEPVPERMVLGKVSAGFLGIALGTFALIMLLRPG